MQRIDGKGGMKKKEEFDTKTKGDEKIRI